jgi:hypothetical protein
MCRLPVPRYDGFCYRRWMEKEPDYPFSRKERTVPKLILAAVAWLYKPGSGHVGDGHAAAHVATRSRNDTRRLRASGVNEPFVNLGPLDLTRTRH